MKPPSTCTQRSVNAHLEVFVVRDLQAAAEQVHQLCLLVSLHARQHHCTTHCQLHQTWIHLLHTTKTVISLLIACTTTAPASQFCELNAAKWVIEHLYWTLPAAPELDPDLVHQKTPDDMLTA